MILASLRDAGVSRNITWLSSHPSGVRDFWVSVSGGAGRKQRGRYPRLWFSHPFGMQASKAIPEDATPRPDKTKPKSFGMQALKAIPEGWEHLSRG